MAKKDETKVEVSAREILQRYWQGSDIKNLARWVKEVEQAIFDSLHEVSEKGA